MKMYMEPEIKITELRVSDIMTQSLGNDQLPIIPINPTSNDDDYM